MNKPTKYRPVEGEYRITVRCEKNVYGAATWHAEVYGECRQGEISISSTDHRGGWFALASAFGEAQKQANLLAYQQTSAGGQT